MGRLAAKMPTTSVRRLISLVLPLQRVDGPDLAPVSDREGGEGEDVRASLVQEGRCLWEALHELLHHALVLGVDFDRRGFPCMLRPKAVLSNTDNTNRRCDTGHSAKGKRPTIIPL